MKKNERKFNSNDFQPKRFGLKFTPPQISKNEYQYYLLNSFI